MYVENLNMPLIISTLGSKGGTGKSTIIFGIISLLLKQKNKKRVLIVNTDESSCTLLLRIVEFNILENENITALDMSLEGFVEFFKKNKSLNFIHTFDYIILDLKGSDVSASLMQDLVQIVDYFITPCLPSRDGLPAFHHCLKSVITAKNNVLNSTVSSEAITFFRSAIATLKTGQNIRDVVELCVNVFNEKKSEIIGEEIKLAKAIAVLNLYGQKQSKLNEDNVEVYRSIVANLGVSKDFEIFNVESMDDKKDLLLSKKDNKEVIISILKYMVDSYKCED